MNQPIGGDEMKTNKVKDLIDLLSRLDCEKEVIITSVGLSDNVDTEISEIEILELDFKYKILVMA